MSTVDDRIVNLKFDNKQFEAGVSETLKSLENLKKGLELKDQQSGLTGLESNVSKVASRFSDLGIIGVGALASIGAKAMDAGIKMAKALTIDPVIQGFSEYELKMGSIQTIMAGTGESLETVNKYLNDLNTYSDKTIYSFSDMTSNIGKFTNAGVSLKDSVAAIQGISNVAARSGANANEASRAMYNFSTAISSGYVQLTDWKSIELANMATKEFKTYLLDTAVAAGTLKKNSQGMYVTIKGNELNATKNFNNTLTDQWMTTEVLTKTLSKYADETTEIGKKAFAAAQDVKTFSQLMATLKEAVGSGWAQSFEIIVGDFAEAKTLFTNISNIVGGIIGQTADARNEILKYWKDTGGRKYVLDALANTFNGLMAIVRPFSEALSEVFTPAIEKGLFNFSSLLLRLSMPFKNLIKESDKLKRTFRGLFAILDIAGQIISALLWPISEISKMFHFVSFGVLDATASMGDFLYNLSKTLKESKVFQKIVEKAFYLVLDAIKALHEVARPYLDMMVTGFRNLQTAIQIFYEYSKPYLVEFRDNIVGLGKIFADIGRAIKDFYNGVKPSLVAFSKNVLEGIVDAFESLRDKVKPGLNTFKTNIINFFNGFKSIKLPGLTSFTEGVKAKFEPLGNVADGIQERFAIVKENFGKLGEGFKKIGHGLGVIGGALGQALDKLRDYFTNMMSGVTFDDVMRVLSTGLLGYIVLQIRNFVKSFKGISDSSSGVLKGITKILDGIRDSMKTWQDTLKADILKKIAIAIGILSVSLLLLSLIDPKTLVASLAAITTLFVELFGAMSIFEVTMGGKQFDAIGKVTRAMVVISIAILILSSALTKMAQVEPDRLNNAVAAIGKLITMMVIYAKAMSKNKDVISESSPMGLIAFATSLVIMASVVTKLGQLDPASLIQGLLGVTALLNLVSQFARKTDLKGLGSIQGPEIVAFALALIILSKAVKIFGDMEPEKLIIGLLAVGVMLGEIAAFTQKLGDDKRVFEAAASMVVIGVALLILTKSVQALGMMDMGQLSQGLFGIGIALTILAVALGALPEDSLEQAAALVVTAFALKMLLDVVAAIGQMPWQVLALGLGAFAIALALIVGAAVIMKNLKITLTLQQFGLAVLLVGAGILAAGIGVGLFVSNLLLLAAGMVGIEAMIIGIKIAIVQLMPFIIQKIGEGLVALAGVIGDNAPVLIAALVKMWIAFVDGIMATVPYTLEQLGILITMLVDFITNQLDTFIQLGFDLLIGLLKGIRDNIGEITTVSIELVNEFINGVAEKTPEMIQTGINFIVTYINSLAEALTLNRDVMIQAFENLINAVVGAGLAVFGFSLPDFTNSGTQTIKEGVIKGINDSLEALKTAIKDLITKGIDSINDKWEDFKSAGKNLVDGLIQGIKDKLKDFTDAIGDLGQTAIDGLKNVLGIHSPSTKFAELGKYAIQGFINGVASLKDSATSQVKEVGNATLDALKRTMDFVSNLANSDMSISPLVTPVIDMSNIQSGTKAISNLLSGTYGLNVGSVVNKLPTINGQNGRDSGSDSSVNGSSPTNVSFVQNNYSPKALSRLDIYRQTKNQISTLKGALNGT